MVQAGVEIEIIRTLTELARDSRLVSSAKVIESNSKDISILGNYVPDKVVHVGHSYGSFMTSGLLARYGNMGVGAIHQSVSPFPRRTSCAQAYFYFLHLLELLNVFDILKAMFLINPHFLNEDGPASFGYEFAKEGDAFRFGDRPSGYVVQKTNSNVQREFSFKPRDLVYIYAQL